MLGDNVTVFVYDGGTVFPYHPDFGSRLWDQTGSCNEDHATNVAGILGGDGSMSNNYHVCYGTQVCWTGTENQWSGIAPHVNITSIGYAKVTNPDICNTNGGPPSVDYNDDKQFSQDYNIISTRHIDLATMSISSAVSGACCLGQYTPTSIAIDNITTGAIANQSLTIFEAVGNRDPTENFTTVDPPATAKNSISVGEIYSKDYSISDTSGFGPTSDGRIKPDIVAPGCYGETPNDYLITTGVNFNLNESNYETAPCGTSYATPLAAGIGSLMVEKWNQLHPNSPGLLPSTVKAILVHTALDLGSPGPSYKYGWGAINAKSAVELIDRNALQSSGHLINVANVSSGKEITFNFTSNTTDDVKATLVWDDPPAAPFAASTLVNQLNLTLIDPSGNHIEPYLLNSSQPNKPATTGNDTVNNVKVAVGNGIPGTWQAVVDGSRVFPNTSQYFTLIISNAVKRSISMSLTPQTVTGQNPVTINATISDNDTGTSLPVSGSVTFGDGNSGGSFSTPNCYTQNGSLVCLVNYTPNSQGNIPITANYTGDLVHAKLIIPNISNSNNNTNQSSTACKSNLATVEIIPVKALQSFTKTPNLIANFFAGKSIKVTNNSTNSHLSNYVTLQNVPDKYAVIHYSVTGQNVTTVAFEDRYGRPESNNNLNAFLQISHKKDTISSMRGIELGGDQILVGLASMGHNTTLANSAEINIPSGNARVMQKFRVPLNASADVEQVPEPVRNFLNGSLDLENLKTGNYLTHYYFLQTVPDNYARLCKGIMNQNVTTIAFEDEYGLNSSNGNLNVFLQISHDSTKVNSLTAVQLGGDNIEAFVNGVDEGSITKSIEIPMK
ncbi:hypothetical protein DYY67_1403 [Candidatus Nitrosotalea sp. TS]|uniref:S8 family serine peptidase n=1 Tax=Candidatus Nitrosotalea sp. TS TaxID=2341020 RepID=UPI00140E5C4B|nr:S8 family serine peptidase [Candidatus Nitrosotalea sp. TS]NHI04028.1 hypothetical protein [Candidatus Nitrosotalea sp. TS]